MASTYTANLRFTLQATGENLNTWGNILNSGAFSLIDSAISGRYSSNSSAPITLTTAQGATDQARVAILDITGGTGTTITAPSVSKIYFVRNASSGDVIVTTSGGSTMATLKAGERLPVFGDGANFYRPRLLDMQGERLQNLATPTANSDAVTKQYADGLAFGSTNLPGINAGTAGKTVTNDGAVAYWDWGGYQGRTAYAAPHTIILAERDKLISATAAIALTLDTAVNLQSKFIVRVANENATAYVTLAPTPADTINGSASALVIPPGSVVDVTGDGVSAFLAKFVVVDQSGPHVILQEQYSSGSAPPSSTSGTYATRVLNTTVRNTVGATLNANQVTLPQGTWRLEARAPSSNVSAHRIRIQNVTDGTTAVLGSSQAGSSSASIDSQALGVVTITAPKAFAVQHYTNLTDSAGFGRATTSGDVEIYAEFRATRISG